MRGIVLAGGKGTRPYPMALMVSKQPLPICDKPLIYYPLSVLLLAGIWEILPISTPEDIYNYQRLLRGGTRIGVSIEYKVQEQPRGLTEAFTLGEGFVVGDQVCLILGNNIFYGQDSTAMPRHAQTELSDVIIFGYPVKNPTNFGAVTSNANFNMQPIGEKPKKPKSHSTAPELYFCDNSAVEIVKSIVPSTRGELEITAVNDVYSRRGELQVVLLSRGITWLDTDVPEGMLQAAEYVETVQARQGFYISCIREVAWRRDFTTTEQLHWLGEALHMTDYEQYLPSLKS